MQRCIQGLAQIERNEQTDTAHAVAGERNDPVAANDRCRDSDRRHEYVAIACCYAIDADGEKQRDECLEKTRKAKRDDADGQAKFIAPDKSTQSVE